MRIKGENLFISTDATFDKIQYLFMVKILANKEQTQTSLT